MAWVGGCAFAGMLCLSNQAIKLTELNKERYFTRLQESSSNHFGMSTVLALGKQELRDRKKEKEEVYRRKLINQDGASLSHIQGPHPKL